MISDEKLKELGLTWHDPTETLRDPEAVFAGFMACLKEGEHEEALGILAAGLRYMNKSRLAESHLIPRRTLYNMLEGKSSPSLELVSKVCKAIAEGAAKKKAAA